MSCSFTKQKLAQHVLLRSWKGVVFRTIGWVLNMFSLLEISADLARELVEQNCDGNLCCSTG